VFELGENLDYSTAVAYFVTTFKHFFLFRQIEEKCIQGILGEISQRFMNKKCDIVYERSSH